MRWTVAGLLCALGAMVAGCFSPQIPAVQCGPDGQCPDGQVCGDDEICREPGTAPGDPDAAVPRPDAAPTAFERQITIAHSGAIPLVDFQVEIEVDTSSAIGDGKMRPDCGDVRFVDDNGFDLDHYLESGCDGDTTFWVQVPGLDTGANTITMRYGNASLMSASDPRATFDWFDDFSTDTTADYQLVGAGWYNGFADTSTGTVTWDQNSERLVFTTGIDTMALLRVPGVSLSDVRVEVAVMGTEVFPLTSMAFILVRAQDEDNWYSATGAFAGSAMNRTGVERKTNGTVMTESGSGIEVPLGTPRPMLLEVEGNSVRAVVDGREFTENLNSTNDPGAILFGSAQLSAEFDDLRVRKHTANPPTVVVGPEVNN